MIGWLLVAGGLLAVIGHASGNEYLTSVVSGWQEMRTVTALSFMISGVMLALLSRWGRNLCSVTCAATLLWMHSFYALVANYRFVFAQYDPRPDAALDAMPSVGTIAVFMLLGIYGVVRAFNNYYRIGGLLGALVVAIGAVAVLGYVIDTPLLRYQFASVSVPMAANTAVLTVLAGAECIRQTWKLRRDARWFRPRLRISH